MSVIVEWHRAWSSDVSNAFEQLPADELMNVDVVRILCEHGSGRSRQKIGVLRDGGTVVGVLPLAWRVDWTGLYAWRLLTQYVMPYARFFVLPGYTDLALRSMGGYFACDNVAFYELPKNTSVLQEETSWVAPLSCTFDEACNLGYTEYDMGRTSEAYKKRWADPEVRGYRLVRGPWGSQLLGNLLEKAGNVMVKAQYKL